MSILDNRPGLKAVVDQIAEVTGYLWQKGWAERNGGNITVNITEFVDDETVNEENDNDEFFSVDTIINNETCDDKAEKLNSTGHFILTNPITRYIIIILI